MLPATDSVTIFSPRRGTARETRHRAIRRIAAALTRFDGCCSCRRLRAAADVLARNEGGYPVSNVKNLRKSAMRYDHWRYRRQPAHRLALASKRTQDDEPRLVIDGRFAPTAVLLELVTARAMICELVASGRIRTIQGMAVGQLHRTTTTLLIDANKCAIIASIRATCALIRSSQHHVVLEFRQPSGNGIRLPCMRTLLQREC